uniref:DPBB_1 domain-containing protein n=1 Tax=Panagrellus redivivus TaxID=6233 RepID=A0A7E4V7I5_PANRE
MLKSVVFIAVIAIAWTIPFHEPTNGHFTYYTIAGTGACGDEVDASEEYFAAVSHEWFTTLNPNTDPICGLCLKISYNHKTRTIPIADKCAHCTKHHMELSRPAFRALVDDKNIRATDGAIFTFVNC